MVASMGGDDELQRRPEVGRAIGRCYGSLFFSIFGAAWLLLAMEAFARLSGPVWVLIGVLVAGFVMTAVGLLRRAGKAGGGGVPTAERKRNDNIFWAINAGQWVLIFVVMSTLPRRGHQDWAIALVAVIVGLHFLVMPPLYRSRANLVTGCAMTVWAVGCALLLHGDRMIGWVALGSGLLLWASAASALNTAQGLLRVAGAVSGRG